MSQNDVDDYVEEDTTPFEPLTAEIVDLLPDIDAMRREVNVDE